MITHKKVIKQNGSGKTKRKIKSAAAFCACGVIFLLALTGCGKKSARDYDKQGMEFYEKGDYDQAEEYLAKATTMDADNVTYIQDYAVVLIQQNRAGEAIELFESTLTEKTTGKKGKQNKYAYRGIGIAYIQLKDYENALQNFRMALSIDEPAEWNTDIKYYMASASEMMGDIDGAFALYDEILKDDKDNAAVYRARANIYRDRGDYAAAISDYEQAAKNMKGDFRTYIGMADCYIACGRQADADDALFKASLLDINTDEDKFYLAAVHYYMGNYTSAKPEMEYALSNGFNQANFYLAEMAMLDEDYKTALDYFNAYVAGTFVISPTVCNDMAVCCINTGDPETGYEWVQKGLENVSDQTEMQLKRNEIACLENMGKLTEAIDLLAVYVADYPEDEGAKQEYNFLTSRVNAG